MAGLTRMVWDCAEDCGKVNMTKAESQYHYVHIEHGIRKRLIVEDIVKKNAPPPLVQALEPRLNVEEDYPSITKIFAGFRKMLGGV